MIECIFGESQSEKIPASQAILALPKRPLERLQLPDLLKTLPGDSKAIEAALSSVKCLQLLKCFFILEDPWWEDDRNLNKYAGDVPTREIAYYKSKDKTKGIIMIYTDHPAITFWSDYLREFEKAADDSQAMYKVWCGETNLKSVPKRGNSKSDYGIGLSNSPGITNIMTFRPIACWLAESGTGAKTHLEERRMVGSPVKNRGYASST
jgi:hypothetical protein